jgi:hypothetical protein
MKKLKNESQIAVIALPPATLAAQLSELRNSQLELRKRCREAALEPRYQPSELLVLWTELGKELLKLSLSHSEFVDQWTELLQSQIELRAELPDDEPNQQPELLKSGVQLFELLRQRLQIAREQSELLQSMLEFGEEFLLKATLRLETVSKLPLNNAPLLEVLQDDAARLIEYLKEFHHHPKAKAMIARLRTLTVCKGRLVTLH